MSPAKSAEPIEMPFGMFTYVGPRNHILDGGPDRPMEMGNFRDDAEIFPVKQHSVTTDVRISPVGHVFRLASH